MMAEQEIEKRDGPEAWVGCLGCYNAGALVGRWVEGTEAGDVTVASLHSENQGGVTEADIIGLDPFASGHEELWVMDHQGYGGLLSGECSPAEAARIAEAIEAIEADGHPVEAVAAWADHVGETVTEWDGPTRESFEDAWCGEWETEQAYAEELADDLGAVPDDLSWPVSYIDWETATRDLFMSDYWSTAAPGGGVYVFRAS